MEIGIDIGNRLRNQFTPAPGQLGESAFDWPGLRARFLAAQAARRVMLLEAEGDALRAGSFAPSAAAALAAAYDGSRLVNRNGLGDGKLPGGIAPAVAGSTLTGV